MFVFLEIWFSIFGIVEGNLTIKFTVILRCSCCELLNILTNILIIFSVVTELIRNIFYCNK